MSAPSEHMRDVLLSKGYVFGVVPGALPIPQWSLWIGIQPTDPAKTVTIYDSAGLAPNPRWLLDYPSLQFRIRGDVGGYSEAREAAVIVRNYLLGIPSFDALDGSGDRIVQVNGIGDIVFTGRDQTQRPEFVFNLALIIEPASTAETNRDPL